MTIRGGTQTLAGTGSTTFTPPAGATVWFLELANLCPFPLLVDLPEGPRHLMIGAAGIFPTPRTASPVTVEGMGTASQEGSVSAIWYLPDDVMLPSTQAGSVTNISLASGASVDATIVGTPTFSLASGAAVDATIEGTPTFDLASGASVDANITNATLDISGSTIDLASGTSVGLSSGTQLSTSGGIVTQPGTDTILPVQFGNGSSGAVTLTADTTMTGEPSYTDLTVSSGVTLTTAGWFIRATGTVTIESTAVIENNGGDGTSTAAGLGGASGSLAGGANGYYNSTATANNGQVGTSPPQADVQGGSGGDASGNAGGSVTAASVPWASPSGFMSFGRLGGGGSGALAWKFGSSTYVVASGGGGGAVAIIADTIVNDGSIEVNGGTGYTSATGSNVGIGGAGGGVLLLLANSYSGTGGVSNDGGGGITQGADTADNGQVGRAAHWVTP